MFYLHFFSLHFINGGDVFDMNNDTEHLFECDPYTPPFCQYFILN